MSWVLDLTKECEHKNRLFRICLNQWENENRWILTDHDEILTVYQKWTPTVPIICTFESCERIHRQLVAKAKAIATEHYGSKRTQKIIKKGLKIPRQLVACAKAIATEHYEELQSSNAN
jgi:hypothetical protein